MSAVCSQRRYSPVTVALDGNHPVFRPSDFVDIVLLWVHIKKPVRAVQIVFQSGMEPVSQQASHILRRFRDERSAMVQGCIWLLLAVVVLATGINVLAIGFEFWATPLAWVPNLLFIIVLIAALLLNARKQLSWAVGLIVAAVTFAALQPLLAGTQEGLSPSLLLLFLPLTLAGLILPRPALYLTALVTVIAVMARPLLQVLSGAGPQVTAGTDVLMIPLQFTLVVVMVTFFLGRFGTAFRELRRTAEEHVLMSWSAYEELHEAQRILIEREQFSSALVENLPGFYFLLDHSGSFQQWNTSFEDTFGYGAERLRDMEPSRLIDEADHERARAALIKAGVEGHASLEAAFVTRSGKRIPGFLTMIKVTLDGTEYIAGLGLDRSEIDAAHLQVRELNEAVVERVRRLDALRDVERVINQSLELELTLDSVVQQFTEQLKVDAAAIMVFEPEQQVLRYVVSKGFQHAELSTIRLGLGEGLAGQVALSREKQLVNGRARLSQVIGDWRLFADEGFASCLCGALVAKDELVGVVQLFHRTELAPGDDWMKFAAVLATQAANALDNASMFRNLERSNRELRDAYETTIAGWARALDLKDEETAGHSERVTDLTLVLARRLAVPEHELDHIRRGALLHDIGKMGVSDGILRKPGKLTAAEWKEMRKHPAYARDLLAPVPFLQPAIDIPYSHHEKWDGSGYPLGLKGEEIPLPARLFAVVDVFDALTSDRPYRKAWSTDEALEHIREQSGKHFDPAVVSAFMELIAQEQSTGRK